LASKAARPAASDGWQTVSRAARLAQTVGWPAQTGG
jgi:hypothetical protein